MRVPIALATGLALTALALVLVLVHSPLTLASANSVTSFKELTSTHEPGSICQGDETVPAGTAAMRLSLLSLLGPRMTLRASAAQRLLTSGEQGSGWTGKVVTIPVAQVAQRTAGVEICVAFVTKDQVVSVLGERTSSSPAIGNGTESLRGRIRIEYLKRSSRSWLSLAASVIHRLGLNSVLGGSAVALLVALLMLTATALGSWLVVRDVG